MWVFYLNIKLIIRFNYVIKIKKMNVSVTRIREFLLRDEIDDNDISHIENEGNFILFR
jgi:hypothetical protein